ncbi:MAG: type 1 fimbrial protein [Burkholderiaceae bacterium]|nr:type 1 fimbrial protein [Burkholderiaceae bacterium]
MRAWSARLAAGLMLTAAKGALAYTCTTVTTSTTIQPQTLAVQRDLPVGGLIAQVVSDVVTSFKCTNEAPGLTYQEVGFKGFGTYVGDFDGKRVWKTNIDGIGYAVGVGIVNGCGAGLERWVDGTNPDNPDHRLYCAANGPFKTQPMQHKALINFYKTASSTGTGTVSGKLIGAFILRNNQSAWQTESQFSIGSVAVEKLSCTLGSAAINVPMGNVPVSAFKGPGTAQPSFRDRAFSIPLTCPKGASINLKLDGTAYDASQGMLKLDSEASSATGVAIQVLYDDKPVELAKNFKWQTTDAEGTYSIPLKARYVQTDNSVTPGVANGSATFTLTYQ